MVVDVHFLGKPKVLINGTPIELEQKKTQALLLYVLFNGSSTRDELAELLWCDYPAESARRNLRNSLYKLKTIVGEDLFVTKGHSFIRISEQVTLYRDIDLFITEDSSHQLFSLPSYVFLEHFYVKNCPEFDSWIFSIRTVYEKLIVKRLSKELKSSIVKKADHKAETCATRILEIDPYHEEACRAIMQVNMVRGDYNAATACYQKLKHGLEEDLDVAPEAETEQLYQRLLELKKTVQPATYGAENQRNRAVVDKLNREYHNFRVCRKASHCILSGDIGMGKSCVLQLFAEEVHRAETITMAFQQSYRNVPYYAVERLLELLVHWIGLKIPKIAEMRWDSNALSYVKQFELLFEHMNKLGRRNVLILQNLEAIDQVSMDIFSTCLFEKEPGPFLIFGEYCPNFETNTYSWERLSELPQFQLLSFPLLDERDSASRLREWLDPRFDQDEILKEGYECTGGNLLLLREFARNIEEGTTKPYRLSAEGMQMVNKLLSSLSPEEYQLLEVLAVLEVAEIEALSQIIQTPSIVIVQALDSLSHRNWLCETEKRNHLFLYMRFGLIQSLLYERMPRYKQVEIHRLGVNYYEQKYQQYPKDLFYLTQLCHHCRHTHDAQKKIYYNVLHLERVLDYYDEFFPTIIDDTIQQKEQWFISRADVYDRFRQYNADLQKLEDELPPNQFFELRMKLDFLQGRAMIRSGQRDGGLILIQNLISLAKKLKRYDMLMKGYVETLCYAVRSENTKMMKEYIKRAHAIDSFETYEKENGVLLRLQGYLCILNDQYEDAERYLKQSIAVFEQPKLRSANYFNIAGAYDYLALNCRRQMKLDEALVYIQKAIDLCVEKNVQKSLDLFYEDCGYILFLKGDYTSAEQYFLQSIELYEQFDTYWLRSIAEGGLAMIYATRGERGAALEHFRKAEVFSQKEMAKEELDVLEQARCVLKQSGIL